MELSGPVRILSPRVYKGTPRKKGTHHKRRKYVINGKRYFLTDLEKIYGIPSHIIKSRIGRGWLAERLWEPINERKKRVKSPKSTYTAPACGLCRDKYWIPNHEMADGWVLTGYLTCPVCMEKERNSNRAHFNIGREENEGQRTHHHDLERCS